MFPSGETMLQLIKEVQNGDKEAWRRCISQCSSERPLSD